MKFAGILAVIVGLMLSTGNVIAIPKGTVEYEGGGAGKVVFDSAVHAKSAKCADCHTKPKLFEMKKGKDKLTMKDMNEGKFCGACHDGKKSFSVKAPADCAKCHKK